LRATQVENDCGFFSDLGADFVTFMELIAKIEDEFGNRARVRHSLSRVCMRSYAQHDIGHQFRPSVRPSHS